MELKQEIEEFPAAHAWGEVIEEESAEHPPKYETVDVDPLNIDRENISEEYKTENENMDLHDEKLRNCTQCTFTCISRKDLEGHLSCASHHSEELQAKCTKCDFKTKKAKHLRQHMRNKHMVDTLKWHSCEHCSYRTKINSVLRKHILLKHTPKQRINWVYCVRCSFKGKSKNDLHKHMSGFHNVATFATTITR